MNRPSLNDLAAFAAIASHRSFRKAADALGVSRSALSHTMLALEQTLGVRLLNRTTRSVSLTDAGARLLSHLGPVFQGLDFDAGVRLAEAVPRDMVAVRLGGDVRFVAVASPAYLDGRNTPATPHDLQQHRCIRQRLPSGKRYRWEFIKHGQEITVDVPGALTLDDSELMVEAAADGLGIAYVPENFTKQMVRSGRLVMVLEDWCPPIPGLVFYYPGNRHVPSALRAFIDTLKETNRILPH
ncbi:LysR family transcriptional regulator [Bradyrhizobium sp. SZCCHNPS2010]|uniref:LysR family transcriptional regulator n=1 Tax=Bradyrhizobium sp. SZCCHNPS2010 TaxID=3057333 RepID=UPI002916210B|nr:LysR family transcriptional regulator [Bradyrhizobium sp. SZCCHNPS2010]